MRGVRWLAATMFAVLGVLVFMSAPALAEQWRVIATFGGSTSTPMNPQPLSMPDWVAVNQSTNEVYVVDAGNNRVEYFSSTGEYEGQFNGASAPTGVFSSPGGIAVDSDPSSPSFGDVYVIDAGHEVVDKFSASGVYLGQLTTGADGAPFGELEGVAVGSDGEVWVLQASTEADAYSNALANVFLSSEALWSNGAQYIKPGLAVNSEGDLYGSFEVEGLVKLPPGEARIGRLNKVEAATGEAAAPTGLAVDPSTQNIYTDTGTSLELVSSTAVERTPPIESFGEDSLSDGRGVAVDVASGDLYVAEPTGDRVLVFARSSAPQISPPAPSTEKATEVTPATWTLHGKLNPEGASGGVGYYFSYNAGVGSSCTGPGSVRTSFDSGIANVTGDTSVPVSATVKLHPHEEYSFCLVADGYGAVPGNEMSLKTGGEKPEVIADSEHATGTGKSYGEFTAEINPESEETKYYFEYSTEVSPSNPEELVGEIKTAPGEEPFPVLPAKFEEQGIGVSVSNVNLEPREDTFYYRVVATNGTGTTKGAVENYTKLPSAINKGFSELGSTSVKLSGVVDPGFRSTEYTFEYAAGPHGEEMLKNGEGTQAPEGSGTVRENKKTLVARCYGETLPIYTGGVNEPFTCENESKPTCEEGTPTTSENSLGEYSLLCVITVDAEFTSLQPGQTYYYRISVANQVTRATTNLNNGEPIHSEIKSFRTWSPPVAVETGGAGSITRASAALFGSFDPRGYKASYYFQYVSEAFYQEALAKSENPYAVATSTSPVELGASEASQDVGPVAIGGLLPGTVYHYRLVADNVFGTEYGETEELKTAGSTGPFASTGPVSGVSQTGATLSGTVTTNGLKTNYSFEIGTEPENYGPAMGLGSLSGSTTETVSLTLNELQPGTTYYYRVTANNADGMVSGEPESFTTPGLPGLLTVSPAAPQLAGSSLVFPSSAANTVTAKKAAPKHGKKHTKKKKKKTKNMRKRSKKH
jgi:hypothetical protein